MPDPGYPLSNQHSQTQVFHYLTKKVGLRLSIIQPTQSDSGYPLSNQYSQIHVIHYPNNTVRPSLSIIQPIQPDSGYPLSIQHSQSQVIHYPTNTVKPLVIHYPTKKKISLWTPEEKILQSILLHFSFISLHCTLSESNPNFRDITRNVVESMILHEIFRVVSRFPRFISCYIAENRFLLGQCAGFAKLSYFRF